MSLKRTSRKKRHTSTRETDRRELQGYLDKLRKMPNKSPRDYDLQLELQQALNAMKLR